MQGYRKDPAWGLSYFCFIIYDLPFALSKVHATTYADDTTIPSSSDNIEETNTVVNAELACLEECFHSNKFYFNIVKIQAIIIGSAQK